jgi:hypothetical protein
VLLPPLLSPPAAVPEPALFVAPVGAPPVLDVAPAVLDAAPPFAVTPFVPPLLDAPPRLVAPPLLNAPPLPAAPPLPLLPPLPPVVCGVPSHGATQWFEPSHAHSLGQVGPHGPLAMLL